MIFLIDSSNETQVRKQLTGIARSYRGALEYRKFDKPNTQQGPIHHNCYGFIRRVMCEAGLPFPQGWGYKEMFECLTEADPKPGDLFFTQYRNGRGHVGLIIPDTKTVVHLSRQIRNVEERCIDEYLEMFGSELGIRSISCYDEQSISELQRAS